MTKDWRGVFHIIATGKDVEVLRQPCAYFVQEKEVAGIKDCCHNFHNVVALFIGDQVKVCTILNRKTKTSITKDRTTTVISFIIFRCKNHYKTLAIIPCCLHCLFAFFYDILFNFSFVFVCLFVFVLFPHSI